MNSKKGKGRSKKVREAMDAGILDIENGWISYDKFFII
jgi:hypothetical protein